VADEHAAISGDGRVALGLRIERRIVAGRRIQHGACAAMPRTVARRAPRGAG
jgi:hypothetical protein